MLRSHEDYVTTTCREVRCNLPGVVGRPIVNDHYLPVTKRLSIQLSECGRKLPGGVIDGEHDRDPGRGVKRVSRVVPLGNHVLSLGATIFLGVLESRTSWKIPTSSFATRPQE